MLDKCKSHAFRKDVYLLGKDSSGVLYWLESPSWDCGWYWGFGYVETYNYDGKRDPSKCTDIHSHGHYEGFEGKQENGKYVYHLNESPVLVETVLTDKESWELSDLMKRFYILKESAEVFHRGNANRTSSTRRDSKNEEMAKYINEVELPAIFAAVIEILSPKM